MHEYKAYAAHIDVGPSWPGSAKERSTRRRSVGASGRVLFLSYSAENSLNICSVIVAGEGDVLSPAPEAYFFWLRAAASTTFPDQHVGLD